jgi:hypothetical protein
MIDSLHQKGKAFLLSLLLFSSASLSAQHATDQLREQMVADGFENVAVVQQASDYYLTYENNLHVWNVDELRNALEVAVKSVPDDARLHIVTLRNKTPLLATEVSAADWKAYQRGELSVKEMESRMIVSNNTDKNYRVIREAKQANSNVGKVDMVVFPGVGLKNERFDKTYEFMFNLTPTLEFSLWKGNYLRGQIIVPIINDGYGDLNGKVRPGFVTIEQNFSLPQSTYLRLTAGLFNSYRRGVDGDLSHLFGNGDWEVGINGGLTGYTLFDGFKYTTEKMSDFSVLGRVRYFYQPLATEVSLKGGKFYSGAKGVRGELVKHFREVSIGVFALLGDGDTNGGFNFSVPLNIPKKYKRNLVRVKAANYFDWEYTYKQVDVPLSSYETRPNENRSEHFFNSGFIKTQLLKQN